MLEARRGDGDSRRHWTSPCFLDEHARVFPDRERGRIDFGILLRGTGIKRIEERLWHGVLLVTLNCGHSSLVKSKALFREGLHGCPTCTSSPECF